MPLNRKAFLFYLLSFLQNQSFLYYMTYSGEFAAYYKTISNEALLDILYNRKNYQDLAVEAAENEFMRRGLSDLEIAEAKKSLAEKERQAQQEKYRAKETTDRIRQAGTALFETISPIKAERPTTGKIITFISLAYAGIFLYEVIVDFRSIIWYFEDIPTYPMVILNYLGPIFLTPVAVFCFYKRKTTGWVLLAALAAFFTAGALWMFIGALTWKPYNIAGFNRLYQRPHLTKYIIQLLFLSSTLYLLCKTSIREIFIISRQKSLTLTFILTALYTVLLLLID